MSFRIKRIFPIFLAALFAVGCETQQPTTQPQQPATNSNTVAAVNPSPSSSPVVIASPSPSPINSATAANSAPVTLPVLDAMFADENFAGELKSKLGLSDEQVTQLRTSAREATAKLKENEDGSTSAAAKNAHEQIGGIIGEEKTKQLAQFVSERWNKDENGNVNNAATVSNQPGSVPTDTRIVVNTPAYRMDVFRDGKLLKSYKVGIGYPEFPLPTATRKASSIIFNPTWTPPDEPWVEGSKTVKAGEKVAAGSKLNPLGPIKIPIGMPSLIHGGKSAAKLGGFASHGCVGLTNAQIKDFASMLAQVSNTEIKKEDLAAYEKNKTETKNVKLASVIPVELRYETIVIEDGKLHIYRDVYERGTNTEENLRKVLEANGVSLDSLSEPERAKITEGLKQMARNAQGNAAEAKTNSTDNSNVNKNSSADKKTKSESAKVTRTIKGAKEFVIEIAALKGKGYPAPLNLSKG
ncbi:MAG: L,D-transpeptidase family protein [Pyrinomonadaceae bacterium]